MRIYVIAVCSMLTLSACGSSGPAKTGALAASAQKHALELTSGQVDINTTTDDGITHLRLTGSFTGGNQEQQQSVGSTHSDGILTSGKVYLKGDSAFWIGSGMTKDAANALNNKWWVGTSTSPAANPSLNIHDIIAKFFASADGKKLLASNTIAAKTTTAGVPTYTLSDPTIRDGATLVITQDKSHALMQLGNITSPVLGGNKATLTFSHLDDVPQVTTPVGAQPIAPALAK